MKILLVEDEIELCKTITSFLESEGHNVFSANYYNNAIDLLKENNFDIILLDITLPDGNGLNLINVIREKNKETGIIIVSARDKIEQKVDGLERGADDYMTKPFHLSELNARIKSLLRRHSKEQFNILEYNEIKLNLDSFQVYVNNTEIILTKTEFELLYYLISNQNRVLTKLSISKHVSKTVSFAYNFSDDFIYTHIKNLRKKLIKANCNDYIKTIYGVGYKFV